MAPFSVAMASAAAWLRVSVRTLGDIIDEFLSFCLAQERAGLARVGSAPGQLDVAAPEIKRERIRRGTKCGS